MSLEEIHFYQAKCDNCGETLEYNSTQFTGNAWYLVPRVYGWLIERGNWHTAWKTLCPKCKKINEVGDAE